MSDTTKILLSLAAVVAAMFGGKVFESAKRLFSGVGVPAAATPPANTFVAAVASLDIAVAYLQAAGQYGAPQEAAAKAIRAAIVDAATPKTPGVKA